VVVDDVSVVSGAHAALMFSAKIDTEDRDGMHLLIIGNIGTTERCHNPRTKLTFKADANYWPEIEVSIYIRSYTNIYQIVKFTNGKYM
jgi:hypothetical protein